MKASELMIGDWVKTNAEGYRKINVITQFRVRTNVCAHEFDIDCIEPIHLTDEILKANGFEYVDEVKRFYLYNEDECMFCIPKLPKCKFWIPVSWYGKGICLEHVHELQHALRLCGLNDIADNLKIQ